MDYKEIVESVYEFRSGSRESLERLCREFDDLASYVVSNFTGFAQKERSTYDIQDLEQEARIGLIDGLSCLDFGKAADVDAVKQFLKTVVYRKLISVTSRDSKKKRGGMKPEPVLELDECIGTSNNIASDDPHNTAIINMKIEELIEAMKEKLSPLEARVMFASAMEGRSLKQIASELGKSVKSIDRALSRARDKLRNSSLAA